MDEDVASLLTEMLRRQDVFDILTTPEAGRAGRGLPDPDQLEFAARENRAIFTHNIKHYEPLAIQWAQEGKHHAGVLVAPKWTPEILMAGFAALAQLYPEGLPVDLYMHLPRAQY